MKKAIALFLIAVLVMGLLTGCGTSASKTESTNSTDKAENAHNEAVESENTESSELLSGIYTAEIVMKDKGSIIIEMDADKAPVTVTNFVDLVNNGFYDGLNFHRIIKGFMMQGGDPLGNGTGGSDHEIKGEFAQNGVNNDQSHIRGAVSMARAKNPDSASSQFFIVHEDSTFLDGQYACFGYVTKGMEIVDEICSNTPVIDSNGTVKAENQPVIESIKMISNEDAAKTESAQTEEQQKDNVSEVLPLDQLKLAILEKPSVYYYTDMMNDMKVLQANYPDVLAVSSIAKTPDDRDVWLFRVGSADAAHKVLIHAGIHAREYITCQLLMEQMCRFLEQYTGNASYGEYTYSKLMQNTAIYVIPMVNPDGMSISQLGMDGVQNDKVKDMIKEIAKKDGSSITTDYLARWKSNANGVDLNRNFDARWEEYAGSGHISSDHYKGTKIGSEPEAAALIKLTEQEMFERTISYHTQGQVVYWYFGQEEPLYSATYDFAKRMGNTTGYPLDANYQNLDPAGYKDWCVYRLDIPSITIEVGQETSPVPSGQYDKIYKENQHVFEETLVDLLQNPYTPDKGRLVKANNSQSSSQEGKTMTVVKCKEFISLRETPSTKANVLEKVPLGEQVKFISTSENGFFKVEYKGRTGYCLAEYLK